MHTCTYSLLHTSAHWFFFVVVASLFVCLGCLSTNAAIMEGNAPIATSYCSNDSDGRQQQQTLTSWPSISEFYTGLDIFITGATGFMGKCLVEKIIRSIPGEGKVYVLVRPKKGKSVEERVKELSNNEVFSHITANSPGKLQKRLVPIEGDISKPRLGISEEDMMRITQNISVIFHLAATIRFDEHIKKALQFNVLAVGEIIKLAKNSKNLKCLVHVSTAYSNCQMERIDEVVYPTSNINYTDLLNSMKWMSLEQFDLLAPSLLEGRPNTYTLTKAMAEQLLKEEAKDLPVAIIRPSIIGAAVKEPLSGWIDCTHGPAGIFVAVGKGFLRVMRIDWDSVADIVPVDYVNNMLMAIGWATAMNRNTTVAASPVVYHCNSGSLNPIDWLTLTRYMLRSYAEYPFDEIFRRPGVMKCRPFVLWPMWQFLLHYMPAYLTDGMLWAAGKKTKVVMSYKKLEVMLGLLSFFTQKTWQWSHSNYDKLLSLLSEEDKVLFNFDMKSIKWDSYIGSFCLGTKRYLLKDDLSNLHKARRQIRRRRIIRYLFSLTLVLVSGQVLFLRSKLAQQVWFGVLKACMKILQKMLLANFKLKKINKLFVIKEN